MSLPFLGPPLRPEIRRLPVQRAHGAGQGTQTEPAPARHGCLAKLDVSDVVRKSGIAGAGFLNFRLKNAALAETSLQSAARGEHLFFPKNRPAAHRVIDFSSPNVAKPMHVGHIRSTIHRRRSSARLRLLGHQVITDNHIGDWGTQFGKLLVGWKTRRSIKIAPRWSRPIGEIGAPLQIINAAMRRSETRRSTPRWKKRARNW
jgi:arginyl-tRNA synthetase